MYCHKSHKIYIEIKHIKRKGGSRIAASSKMEHFVIIVNGWKPLTIITKNSILDVAAVLDPPLVRVYVLWRTLVWSLIGANDCNFWSSFWLERNCLEYCHPLFLLFVKKAKMNFIGNENYISSYVFPVSKLYVSKALKITR